MIKPWASWLIFTLGVAPSAKSAPDLNGLVARAISRMSIPAMSVLLIRDGKVAAASSAGLRARGASDNVAANDVWHIGSDTKAMTATLIARLVDRGVLSWDAPLSKLLPDLGPAMEPAYRSVTLRDLLGHQAGLQANLDMAALDASRNDRRPMHEQRLAYARLVLAQKPAYAPRTSNLYSNSGVVIAATVAEQATGLSYEELMRREVFEPLGMASAGFGPTHRGQPLGHDHGKPRTGPDADNTPVLAPAGEIHLSMMDWAKFAIDQLKGERGDGKLLRIESYRLLHKEVRPGSDFALGWIVSPTLDGHDGPFLTHAGSNTFWYAVIVLAPKTQSGVLVAANAGEDAGADKAEGEIVKAVLPAIASSGPLAGAR